MTRRSSVWFKQMTGLSNVEDLVRVNSKRGPGPATCVLFLVLTVSQCRKAVDDVELHVLGCRLT